MTKEEYQKALKSPKWKTKRKKILERDNYTCTKCDSKKSLHVHHTYYLIGKMPWEVPDGCLITLCKVCHEKEHKGKDIKSFARKSPPKNRKPLNKNKVVKKRPRKERREQNKKLKLKKKLQDSLSKTDRELQKKYDDLKDKNKLPESTYKPLAFDRKSKKKK